MHLPYSSRLWRGDDGAGRSSNHGSDIREIRTRPLHALRCRRGAHRPNAGTGSRRPDRRISSLADDFPYQCADRHPRSVFYLSPPAELSRRTGRPARHHRTDPFWCRRCPALLRPGSLRRAHFKHSGDTEPIGPFRRATLGLRTPRERDTAPSTALRPVSHPNLPRRGLWWLHHTPGRGWNAFSSSPALSGRPWLHAGPIRIPYYASSRRGNELKDVDADRSNTLWLPPGADLQHGDHWRHPRTVRHHRAGHPGLAHRASSLLLRILFLAAIHEYEYARVRRCRRKRHQHGKHHRKHWSTDVDQLRRCLGLASRG